MTHSQSEATRTRFLGPRFIAAAAALAEEEVTLAVTPPKPKAKGKPKSKPKAKPIGKRRAKPKVEAETTGTGLSQSELDAFTTAVCKTDYEDEKELDSELVAKKKTRRVTFSGIDESVCQFHELPVTDAESAPDSDELSQKSNGAKIDEKRSKSKDSVYTGSTTGSDFGLDSDLQSLVTSDTYDEAPMSFDELQQITWQAIEEPSLKVVNAMRDSSQQNKQKIMKGVKVTRCIRGLLLSRCEDAKQLSEHPLNWSDSLLDGLKVLELEPALELEEKAPPPSPPSATQDGDKELRPGSRNWRSKCLERYRSFSKALAKKLPKASNTGVTTRNWRYNYRHDLQVGFVRDSM